MKSRRGFNAFIREVASRAGFTIGDVKIIWDTIIEVAQEKVIESTRRLNNSEERTAHVFCMEGLFSLSMLKAKPYTSKHLQTGVITEFGELYRAIFKPSKRFFQSVQSKMKKEKDLRAEE